MDVFVIVKKNVKEIDAKKLLKFVADGGAHFFSEKAAAKAVKDMKGYEVRKLVLSIS